MVKLIQGGYKKVKEYCERELKEGYFEFDFVYAEPTMTFKEIDRFCWESRHEKTRYKNSYDGPVLIELTGWNENPTNPYFDAFMYFLKDRGIEKCTFFCRDKCSAELMAVMSGFFRVESVVLGQEEENTGKMAIGFSIDEKENERVRG